jgi:DNA-binding LytR/AlgR family response regulator
MLGHEGLQRSRKGCCVNRRKVEESRQGPKINTRNAVASQVPKVVSAIVMPDLRCTENSYRKKMH